MKSDKKNIKNLIIQSFSIFTLVWSNENNNTFIGKYADKETKKKAITLIEKEVLPKLIRILENEKSQSKSKFYEYKLSNNNLNELANALFQPARPKISIIALYYFDKFLKFLKYKKPELEKVIYFFKNKEKIDEQIINDLVNKNLIEFNKDLFDFIELKKDQAIKYILNDSFYKTHFLDFLDFKSKFNLLQHINISNKNSMKLLLFNFLIALVVNRGFILSTKIKSIKIRIYKDFIDKLLYKKFILVPNTNNNTKIELILTMKNIKKTDIYKILPLDNISYFLLLNILRLNFILNNEDKSKNYIEFLINTKDIQNYLTELCDSFNMNSILNLEQLVKGAKSYLYTNIPPVFCDILFDKIIYADFDLKLFDRKYNYNKPKLNQKKYQTKQNKTETITNFKPFEKNEVRKQISILSKIYKILSEHKYSTDKNQLITKINHLEEIYKNDLSTTSLWLIKWIKSVLKEVKISTAVNYMSGLYKHILSCVGLNIEIYSINEFEELVELVYWSMFTHAFQNRKLKFVLNLDEYKNLDYQYLIQRKIRSFFDFYLKNFFNELGYSKLKHYQKDIFNVLPGNSYQKNIRKNIITPREAVLFNKYLETQRKNIRNYQLKKFLFNLGFWLGLRRSEVANLSSDDFFIGVENFVIIDRSKTASGRRKIIFDYIPEIIKKEIISFAKKINYSYEECSHEINELIDIMKHFFANDEIVYHSLRHSFASWTLLQSFNISTDGELNSYLIQKFFKESDFFGLSFCNQEKFKQIYGIKSGKLNSDFLLKLSHIIGHLFPITTISNYIHIIGIYIGYFLDKYDNIDPKVKTLDILVGVNSLNTIKKNKKLKTYCFLSELCSYLESKPLYKYSK